MASSSNPEKPCYGPDYRSGITDTKTPQVSVSLLEARCKEFCKEVVIILHTVNDDEKWAVLDHMKPPANFEFKRGEPVNRPVDLNEPNNIVLGMFGEYPSALIQTRMGKDCHVEIETALGEFPNAKYVLAIGIAFAFHREKCKYGDVLVSTYIDGIGNVKSEDGKRIPRAGNDRFTQISQILTNVFTKGVSTWENKFKCTAQCTENSGRYSKAHPGVIISDEMLINDKPTRDWCLNFTPDAIGGEMEGATLLQIQRSYDTRKHMPRKLKVIIIKGVADYADGSKEKSWQLTSAMAAANYAEHKLIATKGTLVSAEGFTQHQKQVHVESLTAGTTTPLSPDKQVYRVNGVEKKVFEWPEMGISIHTPAGVVPPGITCDITVAPVIPTVDCVLPDESEIASTIFEITTSCDIVKPVTLKIEHCVYTYEKEKMFFAKAQPPHYEFVKCEGGLFVTPNYGVLECSTFSRFGIFSSLLNRMRTCCCIQLLYSPIPPSNVHLIFTKDISNIMEKACAEGFQKGDHVAFYFNKDFIQVNTQCDDSKWTLSPRHGHCTIDKSIVLKYNGNQSAPILSFSVRPKSQLASAESTNDLVFNFNGATNPILSLAFDCSLMVQVPLTQIAPIISEAGIEPHDSVRQAGCSSKPDLSSTLLMKSPKPNDAHRLIKSHSSQWNELGIELDVSHDDREELRKDQGLSNSVRLNRVLNRWINADKDVTWARLIQGLEEIELNSVAKSIKEFLKTDKALETYG